MEIDTEEVKTAEVAVEKPKVMRKKAEPFDPKDPHREKRIADSRKVKGVFKYYECPGQELTFFFGSQYKNDPIKHYKMRDGESYEVPLSVARHLKNDGWYPVHKHLLDENGNWAKIIDRKIKRFDFWPVNDFIPEESQPKIIQVTKV